MRMRKKKNLGARWMQAADKLALSPQAGQWLSLAPGCDRLYLEVGCGKGQFLCRLAAKHPNILFVGVERVPEALLMAMEKAQVLQNLRFVSGDAESLPSWFSEGEADRLFVNFCDPWPKGKQAIRRLTHRNFLSVYRRLLGPGGLLCIKTDNPGLYAFTLRELTAAGARVLLHTRDWHAHERFPGDDEETEYEQKFASQGLPIHRIVATW